MSDFENRCRLVLVAGPSICDVQALTQALSGGDVASVILSGVGDAASQFETYCEEAVGIIQAHGAAAIICDDTQIAGRTDADGIHLERERNQLESVIARFSPQKIVGCGGMMDRHNALQIGELNPDFLLLGKIGKDIKPDAHPKNLLLGEWWAEFVEIPAIVPCGTSPMSVVEVAKTGVDFVLAQSVVFGEGNNPAERVSELNALLDTHAPELLEAED